MVTSFVMLMVLSVGFSFFMTNNPINMGLWVLVYSLLGSLMISISYYSWFGFIMFLIYIGGMLVMFAYFSALQPNQELNMEVPFVSFLLSLLNLPINDYPVMLNSFLGFNWYVSPMYSFWNMSTLLVLGVVLFVTLVVVVKVSFVNTGALRGFML